MKKILFTLISLSVFSLPVFAEEDEDPVSDGAGFVGEVIENTADTIGGAVIGTVQTLGDMASGADNEEDEDGRED